MNFLNKLAFLSVLTVLTSVLRKGIKFFIVFTFFLSLNIAQAITKQVEQLVYFETKANAVSNRSNEKIKIKHINIPLKSVGSDFSKNIDPKVLASLIFEKNGQKYVRWILNPEDTKWGPEVFSYLKSQNIDFQIEEFFNGYKTASRSYIIENPENGALFSAKASTNKTGGNWADKKQPVGEALDSRLISDFLKNKIDCDPFKILLFLKSPPLLH